MSKKILLSILGAVPDPMTHSDPGSGKNLPKVEMMCSLGNDDGGDGGGAGLEHTPARPGIQQPIAENI